MREKMEFYNIGVQDYKLIINAIQIGYGFDFSYYSPIIFRRKILDLMRYYKIDDFDELKFRLENGQFDNDFFRFFHVPITEMFRDPSFWRYVIAILSNTNASEKIRVCFPGCVIGNELLSFLILLKELQMEEAFDIVVTNPFPMKIDSLVMMLKKRKFELSKTNFERIEMKNVDLEKYFDRDNKGNYIFKSNENTNAFRFIKHDFSKNSLTNKQNMIFFRNQLLYFTPPFEQNIVTFMVDSLKPKGLLFIGTKEEINNQENIALINKNERIYQKNNL